LFGNRFNILRIAGINIGIDLSWFIVAILLSWSLAAGYFPYHYPNLSPGTYWAMGIVGMLGLFICVLLHELGHALVAKHFQLPISQITLFIFGGIAEIKKEPPSPYIEILVSIAGPIVSILLALLMYLSTQVGELYGWPNEVIGVTSYLTVINVLIVVFNLIPAFPLDGGRVLRAILWAWKKNLSWAMNVCSALGAGFGFFLIFFGILNFVLGSLIAGFWLFILGVFLQNAAESSRRQFYIGQGLRGINVQKFMTKNPVQVPPDITIKEFIDRYVYESHHHLYPVVEDQRLLGYISLKEVKIIPAVQWESALVRNAMVLTSEFPTISPKTLAMDALNLMHQTNTTTLLVVDDGRLVGIVTSQDLFKLISLKMDLEDQGAL
jgi:Zn-dependent protease/CBS domain-containing protein